MTNYSLVPQEMLACGLPCVELDAPSVVAAFGRDGPIELAAPEPAGDRRRDRAAARRPRAARASAPPPGMALVAARTWDARRRARSRRGCAPP